MGNFECYKKLFESNGLEYSEELHQKLKIYHSFLVEYNEKVNLTAITQEEEVWVKHFIDSILLTKYADIPEGALLIDVGTGAGFPSVPLKLYRPDIKLTLLDSLNKRVVFLQQLCEKLEIQCEAVHGRAEEMGRNDLYREKFDVATARAVAAMPVLSEYCMPFVKVGGVFAAMKGPGEVLADSALAVQKLGGKAEGEFEYTLNGTEGRKIFVVKKISQTSAKYPRNSGQIKNKPL